MAVFAADLCNRALQEVANNVQITSLTDGSPSANVAKVVFAPLFSLLLRQADWDWARTSIVLSASGAGAPAPWMAEFLYPLNVARVRYLGPGSGDPNDPQPLRFAVGTNPTLGTQPNKVIWANQGAPLSAIVTIEVDPTSDLSYADAGFQETLVRLLGSVFAMNPAGRPDFAKFFLQMMAEFEQTFAARPY